MKSNEIELMLRNKGAERGTREVIFRLGEEIEDLARGMKEMAQLLEQLTTVITMQNSAMDNMKGKLDRFKVQDDDPRSTRSLVDGRTED